MLFVLFVDISTLEIYFFSKSRGGLRIIYTIFVLIVATWHILVAIDAWY